MDLVESKRELYLMIEQIPDDSLDEARHLLRELLKRKRLFNYTYGSRGIVYCIGDFSGRTTYQGSNF